MLKPTGDPDGASYDQATRLPTRSRPATPTTMAAIRMMRPMTTIMKLLDWCEFVPTGLTGPSSCVGLVPGVGTSVDNVDPVLSAVRNGEAEPQGHDDDGDDPEHMDSEAD